MRYFSVGEFDLHCLNWLSYLCIGRQCSKMHLKCDVDGMTHLWLHLTPHIICTYSIYKLARALVIYASPIAIFGNLNARYGERKKGRRQAHKKGNHSTISCSICIVTCTTMLATICKYVTEEKYLLLTQEKLLRHQQ